MVARIQNNRTQTIVFSRIEDEVGIAFGRRSAGRDFFEDMDSESVTGNIYLGKVENVVPSLEAAFVNIGIGRNAFLRFKDASGQQKLEKNNKVLVQVSKDPIGSKGPQITLKVSIPGRSLFIHRFRSILEYRRRSRISRKGIGSPRLRSQFLKTKKV